MNKIRKRLNTPNSWPIPRKSSKYIVSSRSSFTLRDSFPLSEVLKNLGLCSTLKEVKFLINNNDVFIGNFRVRDYQRALGIFQILEIPLIQLRVMLILKGKKIGFLRLDPSKNLILPLYLQNKTILKGGNFQLNFFGGNNLKVLPKIASQYSTGDLIYFDVKNNAIISSVKRETGVRVFKGSLEDVHIMDRIILPTFPKRGRRILTDKGNFPLEGFYIYPEEIIKHGI